MDTIIQLLKDNKAGAESVCGLLNNTNYEDLISTVTRIWPDFSDINTIVSEAMRYALKEKNRSFFELCLMFDNLDNENFWSLYNGLRMCGMDSESAQVLNILEKNLTRPSIILKYARHCIQKNRQSDARNMLMKLLPERDTLQHIIHAGELLKKITESDSRKGKIKIAVLSNFSIQTVEPVLRFLLVSQGYDPVFYFGAYNQIMQEIYDIDGPLYSENPDLIFVIQDLFKFSADEILDTLHHPDRRETIEKIADSCLNMCGIIRNNTHAPILLADFMVPGHSWLSVAENQYEGKKDAVENINSILKSRVSECSGLYLFGLNHCAARIGYNQAIDARKYYYGDFLLSDELMLEASVELVRYCNALKGHCRKCIVLDCDNTLWGGIVGEDGVNGIKLAPYSPGKEFYEFQHYLKHLKQKGILLAVCSKNNEEDVLEVFNHPHMVLREEDFAAKRINWIDKAQNIQDIAQELNIGIDSFIFIDDNPRERQIVRELVPEVMVPELPEHSSGYLTKVQQIFETDKLIFTDEDSRRTDMYRASTLRKQSENQAQSKDEYLKNLNICAEIFVNCTDHIERIAALTQKTNQFNLTTRRYDAAAISRFYAEGQVFSLAAKDSFSDHGIVGTAIAYPKAEGWEIDSFLMSCRALGFGLETAFLSVIVDHLKVKGAACVQASYLPTKKNMQTGDFYKNHGFTVIQQSSEKTDYILDISKTTISVPEYITVHAAFLRE